MKVETKVYLPADLAKALDQLSIRTRRPKSEIVRAALASFMSPDGAERTEAALVRRLDRMIASGATIFATPSRRSRMPSRR